MRYFVLGNINAGKTTFINKLKENLPDCAIYHIDEFRKKYGDGTILKEKMVKQKFIEAINQNEDMIVEFSGLGDMVDQIDKTIDYAVFLIDTPLDICLSRISCKKFDEIPYPKFSECIDDTIKRLDNEINEKGLIEKYWKRNALGFYKVKSDSGNYPIKQLSMLSYLLNVLRKYNDPVVSYGSLARNELNYKSDLDLFVVGNTNKDEIVNEFRKSNKFKIYSHLNKVILMNNNLMVEIIFVKSIEQIEKFYHYSNVIYTNSTLLNGKVDLNILEHFKKSDKYTLLKDLKESAEKLVYTIISFELELEKNDFYKLWFDSHIIVHELVKLKSYLMGNRDYIYLPKKAERYFSEEEWKLLDFNFDSNPRQYIKKVKPFAKQILNQFDFLGINLDF